MSLRRVEVRGGGEHREGLTRLVEKVLAKEGYDEVEVCISIVDAETMVNLNRRYTGREEPTDVLAFSLREGSGGQYSHGHLGDVVVCDSQAARQARELAVDPREELRRLVVHGVLHLLGYQHRDEGRRRSMLSVQEAYVMGRWDD